MTYDKLLYLAFLVCFSILFSSGCKSAQVLESSYLNNEVEINGDNSEWAGTLRPFPKEKFALGLTNDSEFLYVSVAVTDEQAVNQVLLKGLMLSFDERGGNEKTWAIHYPLGIFRPGEKISRRALAQNAERKLEQFTSSLKTLEIVRENDERTSHPIDGIPGIEVSANLEQEAFYYELKIPIQETDSESYAIRARPGSTIGLGVHSEQLELEARPSSGQAGGSRGGGGRGAGGGGRGGGGTRPAGDDSRGSSILVPDAIKVWTRVKLAAAN